MKFGLSDQQLETIIEIISSFPEITEAIIFGSRAIGTNRQGSDIDIAIKCNNSKFNKRGNLLSRFEESNLPFFVDIVDYNSITTNELKMQIDLYGVVFYNRKMN
ncbi:MAG TPA: nucleotidyltransferase domain-containing protein [Candidatus Kapabacteria bacterium]|jgi:predicted nucleotidyltransferase|nr:nucleotidyltransferase domain-containing protein [Candidatus Kapabacteria bacterium]HOV92518.1 nucleotidyltransferase domain-containing protein [Candidatus Kapabacteria bacterium]